MTNSSLRVGIIGYGRIGQRRASALADDELVAVVDTQPQLRELAREQGIPGFEHAAEMIGETTPDVVVVSTPNHALASHAATALDSGCHVLAEKPGAVKAAELASLIETARDKGRWFWVGYNHRYHPALRRLVSAVASGAYGPAMFLRARYGHGGRAGYDREWRSSRALAGGGELIDQGGHLLDLVHSVLGPLPLEASLLRTAYWDMEVEDNAVLTLARPADRRGPWAVLQLSCTEWRNEYAVDVYCREARLGVEGLAGSYGPQRLTVHQVREDRASPRTEVTTFPAADVSWSLEWEAFRAAIGQPFQPETCAGALYTLRIIEQSYRRSP